MPRLRVRHFFVWYKTIPPGYTRADILRPVEAWVAGQYGIYALMVELSLYSFTFPIAAFFICVVVSWPR